MTDPKVIEALDALTDAVAEVTPVGRVNISRGRAILAIADLRAEATPAPVETPDDLPSALLSEGDRRDLANGSRATARPLSFVPWPGDVEYVPRDRLDAALKARDEARAALDKAVADEREACARHLAAAAENHVTAARRCAVKGDPDAPMHRFTAEVLRDLVSAIRARGAR